MRCQESALEEEEMLLFIFLSLIFADEFKNANIPGKEEENCQEEKAKFFA